jgi:hypothetical protein
MHAVSLVVYQFEALAGFSAVVDRLGEFQETVAARGKFAGAHAENAEAGSAAAALAAAGGAAAVPVGSEIASTDSTGALLGLTDRPIAFVWRHACGSRSIIEFCQVCVRRGTALCCVLGLRPVVLLLGTCARRHDARRSLPYAPL